MRNSNTNTANSTKINDLTNNIGAKNKPEIEGNDNKNHNNPSNSPSSPLSSSQLQQNQQSSNSI